MTIAGLRGGSGKTILSLGLASAWSGKGHRVAVFKKGPDFIDSGWLSFAAGRPCHNLDPYLMTEREILDSFMEHSAGSELSVIEGNRGLFDGLDLDGCCSTAELGRMLKSPVIIVVDVTMATRTMAALIMGCQKFDPDLRVTGVILNRVAGARQESLVRGAVEQYCGVPVVGAVPKLKGNFFPERHMGLVPHLEREFAAKAVNWVREVVEKHLDLQTLWEMAHHAEPLEDERLPLPQDEPSRLARRFPRVGVIRDSAFWFYYPENLIQIQRLGATVVEIDSMRETTLPALDALYIGGGFPETQARSLSGNVTFMRSVKQAIEQGLPVYAECGGLMYLGESLLIKEKAYPMVGALPITFILEEKPQGHGYTLLEVTGNNPFYPVGRVLKGHEFHYSKAVIRDSREVNSVFKILRGRGIDGTRDGVCKNNLLATYTHVHAGGCPLWAEGLVRAAGQFRERGSRNFSDPSEKKD